jgi:vitamin B12 transporter
LKPETSIGFDLGFEQALLEKHLQFGTTYFHNNIDNLIDINNTATSYVNVGRATTYGLENFVTYTPWEPLTLRADYTFLIAKDDILDQELLRPAKEQSHPRCRLAHHRKGGVVGEPSLCRASA